MELFICDADGGNLKQLTNLGNANWSPFFHPSGKKILFSSNFEAERGSLFNLYMIDIDGKNLTRITHGETFDAFPVFSNDGKKLHFLQIEIMETLETLIYLLLNGLIKNFKIKLTPAVNVLGKPGLKPAGLLDTE